jgi:hypothetical protein
MTTLTEKHEAALIAAILKPDGPIARSKLRALLPHGVKHYAGLTKTIKEMRRGDGRAGENDVSLALSKELHTWDQRGWIKRTDTHIEAVDRAALKARLAEVEERLPKRKTIADIERETAERKRAEANA